MTTREFSLEEVRHIISLSESYKETRYDGFVLVDPERAANLLEALRKYPEVFELQTERLTRQLRREKEATDITACLMTKKHPFSAMAIVGMDDVKYRKQCVELYESLSDQKRENLLKPDGE